MATRCLGHACRCLQLVRSIQPSIAASNCFSLRREVLLLAGKAFSVGLWTHQYSLEIQIAPNHLCETYRLIIRQKGDFCPLRYMYHGTRLLHVKEFSTMVAENNRVLYSLISVKVKGSDEAVLKSYTEFITKAASHLKLDISGRIVLPTSIQRHTVLKSPHIYKKHRAQYEVRTHARMLQIKNVTGDTADTFIEYIQRNIPEGVSMSVEQTALEPISEFLELPPQAQAFLEKQKNNKTVDN